MPDPVGVVPATPPPVLVSGISLTFSGGKRAPSPEEGSVALWLHLNANAAGPSVVGPLALQGVVTIV